MFKFLVLFVIAVFMVKLPANTHEADIKELLKLLDIPFEGDLVQTTQKYWFQKDKEKWLLDDDYANKKDLASPILQRLGVIQAISAREKDYTYALVLGGWQQRVEERMQTLIKEWERGVRFDNLVFLTGERLLDKETESWAENLNTETEMMIAVYEEMTLPEGMNHVSLTIINTPHHENGTRPNTADTVRHWLKSHPHPGKCLAVSSQPFHKYQDSVLKTHFPSSFQVETISAAVNEDYPFAIYLDSLARFLYQEQIRGKK